MNKNINRTVEKIYNTFNAEFFDNKLPKALINFSNRSEYSSLNKNSIVKDGEEFQYPLTLPIGSLNKNIDEFAVDILSGMIRIYDCIHNTKMISRRGTYFNARFKEMAEGFGLTCVDTGVKHGWVPESNIGFANLCKQYGFKKTWDRCYQYNEGKSNTSTKKIICPTPGCKVNMRRTKEYPVICGECYQKFNKIIYLVEE